MSDWTCSNCRWVNRDHATVCLSCGAGRDGADSGAVVAGRSQPDTGLAPALATAGGATVAWPGTPVQAAGPAAFVRSGGLAGGLAAGVIAAVLASAVWYAVVALSEYQIGFVAALIGWLVGTGVVFGSRGRVGLPLIAISGLLTLTALVISEYLIFYHLFTQELGVSFELMQSPVLIIEIALESVAVDPATLVFWAFAVMASVYIPFKAMRQIGTAGPSSEG